MDLRDTDQKGILWLLDEESIFPGATDESFMERLYIHYGDESIRRKISNLVVCFVQFLCNVNLIHNVYMFNTTTQLGSLVTTKSNTSLT